MGVPGLRCACGSGSAAVVEPQVRSCHVSVLALQPALNPFASATRCCSSTPTATAITRTLAPSVRPDILLGPMVAARRQLHSWPSRHKWPAHGRCGHGSSSVACRSSVFYRRFDCLQLARFKFAQLTPRASCTKLQCNTFTPPDARAQFCSAHSVYSSTHGRCCCAQPSSNHHGQHPHNGARKARHCCLRGLTAAL